MEMVETVEWLYMFPIEPILLAIECSSNKERLTVHPQIALSIRAIVGPLNLASRLITYIATRSV